MLCVKEQHVETTEGRWGLPRLAILLLSVTTAPKSIVNCIPKIVIITLGRKTVFLPFLTFSSKFWKSFESLAQLYKTKVACLNSRDVSHKSIFTWNSFKRVKTNKVIAI